MNTLIIIFATLVIYSLITTIILIATDENETVMAVFAYGIVGLILKLIIETSTSIHRFFKYRFRKYSIYAHRETEQQYKCKTKDADDIDWLSEYRLIKRYVSKSKCKDIPDFDEDTIAKSKINCDRCKYYNDCDCNYPYTQIKCKHDEYGTVTEFDKFEKK